MKAAHQKCQNGKLRQRVQRKNIQADQKVSANAHEQQLHRGIFVRKPRKHQRTAKRHHLRGQQKHHLPHGVQIQIGADIDAVINDGAHAVDIQKKRNEKIHHLFIIAGNVPQRGKNFAECVFHAAQLGLHIVFLAVIFYERQCDQKPPPCRDRKADALGYPVGQNARHIRTQHIGDQCHRKRNAGAQIPPRIAEGRNHIHAVFFGDIPQHGIVDGLRAAVAYTCQHIHRQKYEPTRDKAVEQARQHAHAHNAGKNAFFHALMVGQYADHRPQQRHKHCGQCNGQRVIRRGTVGIDLPRRSADGDAFEPNGDQRAGQHNKR